MGHHNSIVWMGFLLALFTPISQNLGEASTKNLDFNSAEQFLSQKLPLDQHFVAGGCIHRGSGRDECK